MAAVVHVDGGASKGPVAAFPAPGTREFKAGLFNCCANGCCSCCMSTCYYTYCMPCFMGDIFAKAGEPYLVGCCMIGSLMHLRSNVRRYYGIAETGCPNIGCGSDCLTATLCGTCVACQLKQHLDAMEAEGTPMKNGVPK